LQKAAVRTLHVDVIVSEKSVASRKRQVASASG
jgi:hypothetical protein